MSPSAFISYSWDDDEHRQWVRDLATQLRADGIETILDQWHAAPGDQLPAFMEQAIRRNDYVLIVCTPRYKDRSDAREGGVGYEGDIMTAEVLTSANHRKFIPILRRGSWTHSAPTWLAGKFYVDLSSPASAEGAYTDLLVTLLGTRSTAPPVGNPRITATLSSHGPEAQPSSEDIQIEGIVVDEVSVPRLDGTPGSALYRVPFRLSRRPPADWATLFVKNWDHPPRFTMMHRPGIAYVVGQRIVLDGTTMDEIGQYHRDTLKLALAETNRQYGELKAKREAAAAQRRAMEEQHRRDAEEKARKITFD